MMAVGGAEVVGAWSLSSGFLGLLLLLFLLSVFLTSLCSDCDRHSFELQDAEVERRPPMLIQVVKLEDTAVARENPTTNEIRNDEQEGPAVSDLKPEEENSTWFKPWRSHLGLLQNQDISSPPSSELHHSPAPTAMVKVNPPLMSVLPPTSTSQDALNSTVPSRDSSLQEEGIAALGTCPLVEEVEEDLTDGLESDVCKDEQEGSAGR